jgi:hypothetical protein
MIIHTSKCTGFDTFTVVQLFSAVNCWLKCMLLEPYNQTDHPECKSRPDSGLSAITELDPGYITGKLIPHFLFSGHVKISYTFKIIYHAIICSLYHKPRYSMLNEMKFALTSFLLDLSCSG